MDAVLSYLHDNIRFILEGCMVILLIYVLTRKPKKTVTEKLTEEEIDELINDWKPEPLSGPLTEMQKLDALNVPVITGTKSDRIEVDGVSMLNLATSNPLGFIGDETVREQCEVTLRKYGCGSCGPRGFYGSIDVHIRLEEQLAEFMGVEQAILYSSAFATIASAIPTFSKAGDIIFCDEGVNHAVQVGVLLSRSKVVYFKHNDMDDLSKKLEEFKPVSKKQKRFVVVESLYFNYGDLCPLEKVMELKKVHHFYLILDESQTFGVLGETGRGICEHKKLNVKDIDILVASLSSTFGSVGGFCCGSSTVVSHQRLNGSGYVFSASSPPFQSVACITALNLLQNEGRYRLVQLQNNLRVANEILHGKDCIFSVENSKYSPLIHLRLADGEKMDFLSQSEKLQSVVDEMKKEKFLLTRAKYIETEKFLPRPSLRLCISSAMNSEELKKSLEKLLSISKKILQ